LILADELQPIYDVVLISCKTFDLKQALNDLSAIKGKGIIIPFLNGIEHFRMLDKTFGEENVMGGLAIISSTLHQDGSIEHFGNLRQNITFGNRDNKKNDILLTFYEICKKSKFDVTLSEQINSDLWKKWVFISTVAGATTLFGCSLGDIVKHNFGEKIISDLYKECRLIAESYGYTIEDEEANNIVKSITAPGSPIKASMQRDVEKNSFTEHEEIFGDLISKANVNKIECPILMSCYVKMKVYQETLNLN
jgi:2-dehydropantoate 2-reductase